jgi:Phosphatidylinositol 3- and 4-kinase
LHNRPYTHRLICRWYSTVRDIKNQLNSITKQPVSRLHLFHPSKPYELNNSTTLHDLGIEKDGQSMKLAVDYETAHKFTLEGAHTHTALLDHHCLDTIRLVRIGLDRSRIPGKTDILDSTGGVYFMRSHNGANVAVFKPRDEEQGMENNPKGYSSLSGEGGLRPYFKPGQGCLREVAAYVFDVDNFCGVPPTTLVHCEHPVFNYPRAKNGAAHRMFPKLGSLQKFIHGESFEDIGASKLSDFEVQKIALLDLRILNGDRNSNNILAVRKFPSPGPTRRNSDVGLTDDVLLNLSDDEFDANDSHLNVIGGIEFELVPIDHGYAFPPKLAINDYDWTWFNYPQLGRDVVPEIREYMLQLDIDVVVRRLQEAVSEIAEDTIFLIRLSHLLIKEGLAAGLNLRDIASLVARMEEDEPSKLEMVVTTAEDNAYQNILLKSTRSGTFKRGQFFSTPQKSKTKKYTASTLPAVLVSEREASSDSSGDSDDAKHSFKTLATAAGSPLRRMASLYSPDVSSSSPVSVTNKITGSDISRESSSDSLSDKIKWSELEDLTSSGDASTDSFYVYAKVADMRDDLTKGFPMNRIASFAGFDSVAIDDHVLGKKNSMHGSSQLRERKKAVGLSDEFKHLKWKLASDGVRAMIVRAKKNS